MTLNYTRTGSVFEMIDEYGNSYLLRDLGVIIETLIESGVDKKSLLGVRSTSVIVTWMSTLLLVKDRSSNLVPYVLLKSP